MPMPPAGQKSGTSELSLEVLQNPLIQGLKAEIARAESQLSQISSNFGKNHPQVQQLEAQIAEQRQQLREEIGRISGGAAVASKFGIVKQDELKKAIEEQKKRVLDLRSQRDELSVLVNDVETARRAYEAVGQRMTQTNLEGQSQQTNVLVLSPATEPTKHSRPRVFLNVLISIFLGGMLGVGAALVLELGQPPHPFGRRPRPGARPARAGRTRFLAAQGKKRISILGKKSG